MRARRVDANHGEIVKAFRSYGFSVADTSGLGGGFPDCVISRAKKTALVEIKDGKKPKSARQLTEAEANFALSWQGKYFVVLSIDGVEAIAKEWMRLC